MAVILNIVADKMPKSPSLPSLGISNLLFSTFNIFFLSGWFIIYEIILCGVALVCSTVLLLLHKQAVVKRWRMTKLMQSQEKTAKWQQHKNGYDESNPLTIITALIIDIDDKLLRNNNHRQLEHYWTNRFAFADHLLLVLFQIAHLVGSLIIFCTT